MATVKTDTASGKKPAPIPVAQELVSVKESIELATGDINAAQVVQMLILPADCVPVGYVLMADDLDSGTAAITLDLGILNDAGDAISTAADDGGDEWLDGSTLAQAGGLALHTASKTAYEVLGAVQPVDHDRIVAVVISVDANVAQAGTISLELSYKAA